MHKPWIVAAVFGALVGCAPKDSTGEVTAYVYALDGATGLHRLQRAQVRNLESLQELRGRDAAVKRNSGLEVAGEEVTIHRGVAFELDYSVDAEGTIVPADLDSLYALSHYRAVDRVAQMLREHGHAPLQRLDVLWFPRVDHVLLGDLRGAFTDNAAYISRGPGFLVLPTFVLADLPLLLNEGVVAHEFGHAVIHQELFGTSPTMPDEGKDTVANRHLASMHEGVADLIGFAFTGNPNFIGESVDIDRDLSKPKQYAFADAMELEDLKAPFDPHRHGSIMARALYELWPKQGGQITAAERSRMLKTILAGLRTVKFHPGFQMTDFASAFLLQMTAPERSHGCEILQQRLIAATRPTACR